MDGDQQSIKESDTQQVGDYQNNRALGGSQVNDIVASSKSSELILCPDLTVWLKCYHKWMKG